MNALQARRLVVLIIAAMLVALAVNAIRGNTLPNVT